MFNDLILHSITVLRKLMEICTFWTEGIIFLWIRDFRDRFKKTREVLLYFCPCKHFIGFRDNFLFIFFLILKRRFGSKVPKITSIINYWQYQKLVALSRILVPSRNNNFKYIDTILMNTHNFHHGGILHSLGEDYDVLWDWGEIVLLHND